MSGGRDNATRRRLLLGGVVLRVRQLLFVSALVAGAVSAAAVQVTLRADTEPSLTATQDHNSPATTAASEPAAEPTTKPAAEPAAEPATEPAAEPLGSLVPSTSPATGPAVARFRLKPAAPLPVLYHVLLSRSLFARDGAVATATAASHVVSTGGGGEATLVFRGVGVSDDRRSAYIENMATKQITRHHEGERLAGGRISLLNLDELEYQAGGQTKRIRPGQNLAGQAVAAPAPPASQPASAPAPGGPPGKGPPGQPQVPPGMTPEQAAAMRAVRRGQPQAVEVDQ